LKERTRFGEAMHKQKLNFQHTEHQMNAQIEADFKTITELKARVENSTKAIEKVMKDNALLKQKNEGLEKQLEAKNNDFMRKISVKESKDTDLVLKYKKKCKKLTARMVKVGKEMEEMKGYYDSLVGNLEGKLADVIRQNNQLIEDFKSFRDNSTLQIQHAEHQLNEMRMASSVDQADYLSKEQENLRLKEELKHFKNEISLVKRQLQALSQVHHTQEKARQETEIFVSDIVSVNEMLVQSIQNRKISQHNSHQSSVANAPFQNRSQSVGQAQQNDKSIIIHDLQQQPHTSQDFREEPPSKQLVMQVFPSKDLPPSIISPLADNNPMGKKKKGKKVMKPEKISASKKGSKNSTPRIDKKHLKENSQFSQMQQENSSLAL